MIDTASLSGAILFIVVVATAMAWALTQSGFSSDLSAAILNMPGGRAGFLVVSIVFFICLGKFAGRIASDRTVCVVAFSGCHSDGHQRGALHDSDCYIDGRRVVHSAVWRYWAACAIGQVDPDQGMRPLIPYLIALLIGLALIAAVPWISIGFL